MIRSRHIKICFLLVVLVYLGFELTGMGFYLKMVLKPAIVGSLIWLVLHSGAKPGWLLTALIFSLAGDVLLMLPGEQSSFFLAGLTAFLAAHIAYIRLFLSQIDPRKFSRNIWPVSLIFLIGYTYLILRILVPSLGELLLPVMVYVAVILTMAFLALNRYRQVPGRSFYYVAIGALLFVLSDSILALNRFHSPLPHAGFLIMSTYSMAQFALVEGLISKQ